MLDKKFKVLVIIVLCLFVLLMSVISVIENERNGVDMKYIKIDMPGYEEFYKTPEEFEKWFKKFMYKEGVTHPIMIQVIETNKLINTEIGNHQ